MNKKPLFSKEQLANLPPLTKDQQIENLTWFYNDTRDQLTTAQRKINEQKALIDELRSYLQVGFYPSKS